MRIWMIVAIFSIWSSACRCQEAYLYDLLQTQPYKSTWISLMRSPYIPKWLFEYAKEFDGPTTPIVRITSGNSAYLFGSVCITGSCDEQTFFYLFLADGTKAWGALLTNGSHLRFVGDNNNDAERILRERISTE